MAPNPTYIFVTKQLAEHPDYLAPDGSEIRLLPWVRGGGLAHCTLPAGKTSQAVVHRNVEEIWYCLSGKGEIWRQLGEAQCVDALHIGVSITIPTGANFQFRNSGGIPLCILIATMPPWPGKEEAVPVDNHWTITPDSILRSP